jgi:hypothetical protein
VTFCVDTALGRCASVGVLPAETSSLLTRVQTTTLPSLSSSKRYVHRGLLAEFLLCMRFFDSMSTPPLCCVALQSFLNTGVSSQPLYLIKITTENPRTNTLRLFFYLSRTLIRVFRFPGLDSVMYFYRHATPLTPHRAGAVAAWPRARHERRSQAFAARVLQGSSPRAVREDQLQVGKEDSWACLVTSHALSLLVLLHLCAFLFDPCCLFFPTVCSTVLYESDSVYVYVCSN